MTAVNKIAWFQNRHDDLPNQQLARELVEKEDRNGIQEIADHLRNKEPNIQSDCIKVLYETGYLAPELIAEYVDEFLTLLKSRNNRMVWGSMIALATISELRANEIHAQVDQIKKAMENGSVITVDHGVTVLATVAAKNKQDKALFSYLVKHLTTCRPKDVAQHAERMMAAVDGNNKGEFIAVLERRMTDLSSAQAARVKKMIKEIIPIDNQESQAQRA